jgi:hypothetical protein
MSAEERSAFSARCAYKMDNEKERAATELERDADAAHEQRVAQIADMVRRIPGAEGRANATRALSKLKSNPDAVTRPR